MQIKRKLKDGVNPMNCRQFASLCRVDLADEEPCTENHGFSSKKVELSHPRICVIGAGPSGLTAIKNLQEQGLTNISVFRKKQASGWQLGL